MFDYVLRDLTDPQGGFYAAEDADSEGQEGTFYVWTPQEIAGVLGPDEAELFNRFYGVSPDGNFEHGTSILSIEQPLEPFAKLKGFDQKELAQRLATSRANLLAARATRLRPHRDDKILTSWNGLMIAALAYGASTLNQARYLQAAQRAAEFILTTLTRDRMLLRRYRDGQALYPGTLEDYAFFSYGLVELYEASFDSRWLSHAKQLATHMIERFWDEQASGFFLRGKDESPLIVRLKEIYDGAIPSGNSVAALVLLKLGRLTADRQLEELGRRALEGFAQTVGHAPFNYPQLLIAWDFAVGPTKEIVIAGEPSAPLTAKMVRALHDRFLPRTVTVMHSVGPDQKAIEALVPYVKAQGLPSNESTAYVCENYICNLPTTDLERLAELLEPPARSTI